jgi:hypothetical protein
VHTRGARDIAIPAAAAPIKKLRRSIHEGEVDRGLEDPSEVIFIAHPIPLLTRQTLPASILLRPCDHRS